MNELFSALTGALEGAWPLALGAALLWGLLSVLLSPCHLSSIPLLVGFIGGQGRVGTRRAALLATLFGLGILITIAVIGLGTALAGSMLGDVGSWTSWLVAAILLLVGLHLMDLIPLPLPAAAQVGMERRGALAAFLLGLGFGIALGPCTFAFMAPLLALSFTAGAERPVFGTLLLLAYGIGHTAVIALAGTFGGFLQGYLDWNRRSGALVWMRRACGFLVILGAFYLVATVL